MNEPVSVREVMNREYVGVSESDGLLETTDLLVREEEPTALVLRGSDPVGVVSKTDVLSYLLRDGEIDSATVGDAMTDSVPSVTPDARLAEVRDRMATWATKWMLVVEDGEPLGTVTEHDILSTAHLESETTTQTTDQPELATTGQAATTDGSATVAQDSFEEQGICSACGTLTQTLASFNGQLLCTDCRDV